MNVLILAAGQEQSSEKSSYPLCLSEINSEPLIQHILKKASGLNPSKVAVAFLEEDVRRYHLKEVIKLLLPKSEIIQIGSKTRGALCTALLSMELFDFNEELLIINGNEFIDVNFNEIVDYFRKQELDAGTVVFSSVHPRYSYVRLDENNYILEASEKRPISRSATAGFYWYSKTNNFFEAGKSLIRKDAHINQQFYICPVFNELVLNNKKLQAYWIDSKNYHPLKNENELNLYSIHMEKSKDQIP